MAGYPVLAGLAHYLYEQGLGYLNVWMDGLEVMNGNLEQLLRTNAVPKVGMLRWFLSADNRT